MCLLKTNISETLFILFYSDLFRNRNTNHNIKITDYIKHKLPNTHHTLTLCHPEIKKGGLKFTLLLPYLLFFYSKITFFVVLCALQQQPFVRHP